MIKYRVRCGQSHEWEAWFDSAAGFDAQVARGLVECPLCGDTHASRAIMAPNVARTDKASTADATPTLSNAPDGLNMPPHVRAALDTWREHLTHHAENVGDRFADEARAMHDNDKPARAIYGTANTSDVRALLDDGVPIMPVPDLAMPKPKVN